MGKHSARFSVGIRDVWDYCVTANGDSVTFTDLLITTAPFLLQEPFLLDRPKSTRSFLGHMTLLTASSLSTFQKSVLHPSSKLVLFMYFVCMCTVLVIEARGGREVEALRYKPEAAGSIPDGVLPAAL